MTRQQTSLPEAVPAVSYSLNREDRDVSSKKAVVASSLLRIDSKYIVRDLIKTLLISGILFTLLIGIYFYLGYN